MTTETTAHPVRESAAEIAGDLGETEAQPRQSIVRVVRALGEKRTRAIVAHAQEIHDAGGMMVPDGSRRRTLGGVFFVLAREELTADLGRKKAFQVLYGGATRAPVETVPAGPAFDWTEFAGLAEDATSEQGEATTVKLTVIGRPGKPVERGDVVVLRMKSEKTPTLPKGVPAPTGGTDYMVLVGRKQWSKVAAALALDPADKVIIEGYPTVRPDFAGITVHATSATTSGIQAGKRAEQQTAASADASPRS